MRSSHATFWLDVKKCKRDDLHLPSRSERKRELSCLQLFNDFGKIRRNYLYWTQFTKVRETILSLNKYLLNNACHVPRTFANYASFVGSCNKFMEDRSRHFEHFHPWAKLKLPHFRSKPRLSPSFFSNEEKQVKFTLRVFTNPRLELLVNLCHSSFEGEETVINSILFLSPSPLSP